MLSQITWWMWVIISLSVICFIAYLIERYHRIAFQNQFLDKSSLCDRLKQEQKIIACFLLNDLAKFNDYRVISCIVNDEHFFAVVCVDTPNNDTDCALVIKKFYFDPCDENDLVYAANCAEELCEMLNQNTEIPNE